MSSDPAEPPAPAPEPDEPKQDRREFMKTAACVALGGACVVVPIAAGMTVLLGPLSKPAADGSWVQLTKLNLLAVGGAPRLFQVFIERTDAWTRHPRSAVGSVFLERLADREVRAFNASCPHLGCSVDWRGDMKKYYCPCHDSSFTKDGGIIEPSPAARPLDTLLVEIRGEDEVWVRFQDFKAGTKEKIAVA
jgi:menaquinol-cytochrome c reductase iron-sulfur subunit